MNTPSKTMTATASSFNPHPEQTPKSNFKQNENTMSEFKRRELNGELFEEPLLRVGFLLLSFS